MAKHKLVHEEKIARIQPGQAESPTREESRQKLHTARCVILCKYQFNNNKINIATIVIATIVIASHLIRSYSSTARL